MGKAHVAKRKPARMTWGVFSHDVPVQSLKTDCRGAHRAGKSHPGVGRVHFPVISNCLTSFLINKPCSRAPFVDASSCVAADMRSTAAKREARANLFIEHFGTQTAFVLCELDFSPVGG